MKKLTKMAQDIKTRFEFANAERSIYEKGSEHYETLSEIIKMILGEYGKHYVGNRYSFRLQNGKYRLVCLAEHEKF